MFFDKRNDIEPGVKSYEKRSRNVKLYEYIERARWYVMGGGGRGGERERARAHARRDVQIQTVILLRLT